MRYRLKYLLFTFLCIFAIPLITHAECDYQRQAELSRLASNVQLNYTYDNNGFTVIMTNLTKDLYAVDNYGQIISGGSDKTFNYASGTISFDIYPTDTSCSSNKLITKTITLPTLNSYSYYDECKQYPDFKYCQLWGDFTLNDEQFNKELEKFVNIRNAEISSTDNDKVSVLDVIWETLRNNAFMFIFLGIVSLITFICVKLKKTRR